MLLWLFADCAGILYLYKKVKPNVAVVQDTKDHRGVDLYLYAFFNLGSLVSYVCTIKNIPY